MAQRAVDSTNPPRRRGSGSASETVAGFLPDFCDNRTVFLTVLVVELLAFVLALAKSHTLDRFWTELALVSLFVQWVALAAAMVLCRCRRWLARLPPPTVTLIALGIVQSITLLGSLVALRLVADANFGFGPPAPLSALLGNQAISGIITLLALRYFYVQHQWKQHVEAEARARFQSLQSRIHPHFLFNTLNTIAGLIRTRPDQAEQAVLDLGDLLRSALANQERITLGDELELTRRYLAIEHLRMGDRLQVDWQLAADLPLDTPLPALLLQPLVENAIHHGIQSLPEGGQLTIRIARQAHGLRFTITNPRLSGTSDSLQGQRLAQDNIRQRLLLVYGVASRLEIAETAERYQVAFTVPLVES
jgi:two-component system, LytTR family, sensor histidine kinase AlgZ